MQHQRPFKTLGKARASPKRLEVAPAIQGLRSAPSCFGRGGSRLFLSRVLSNPWQKVHIYIYIHIHILVLIVV